MSALVEAVLGGIMPVSASSPWWEHILGETRERLRDPGLRAHQLAAAIPLSERQLTRILAARQMTWSQLLLLERLKQLRSDLLARTPGTTRSVRSSWVAASPPWPMHIADSARQRE
ncbi:hypothetical protein [Citricoccus alkalitolerans]|uniref:XRE family transcriptional regulator n=1 Tax=Citricoccus alkalitolerans TaxID=246603 RepID=A0ABV8XXG3_9MICC